MDPTRVQLLLLCVAFLSVGITLRRLKALEDESEGESAPQPDADKLPESTVVPLSLGLCVILDECRAIHDRGLTKTRIVAIEREARGALGRLGIELPEVDGDEVPTAVRREEGESPSDETDPASVLAETEAQLQAFAAGEVETDTDTVLVQAARAASDQPEPS